MNKDKNIHLGDAVKEALFSELDSLLSSGLDFSNAFGLLIESENNPKHKALLKQLYRGVVGGESLWQAVEQCKAFSALDSGVIRIGEETGRLNESLAFLADYYHKKAVQRRLVMSAIRYPLIVLCVAVIVVIFMLAVIVPMFEQVYSRMGGELPAITQWIISVSKAMPRTFVFMVSLIGTATLPIYRFRHTDAMRSFGAKLAMGMSILSPIVRRNNQAHFCKLLYLLIGSGVPLLYAVEMLKDIITFYPYQRSFETICAGLRRGEQFSGELARFPQFYDRKLVTLLKVGEETNRLPEMLLKQSNTLTAELEYSLQKLGSLLEPVLILLVGVLVAVILVSMYLPMFSLGGIMG